jgi:hypothetical protein
MSIITGERPRFRLAIFAAGALAAGTMGFAGPAQAAAADPNAVSGTVTNHTGGAALPEAYVYMHGLGPIEFSASTEADSDGQYMIDGLSQAGSYEIEGSSGLSDGTDVEVDKIVQITQGQIDSGLNLDLDLNVPLDSVDVTLTGGNDPAVGETLTASATATPDYALNSSWSWYRVNQSEDGGEDTPIPGATGPSYTVTTADLGLQIYAVDDATSTAGWNYSDGVTGYSNYSDQVVGPYKVFGTAHDAEGDVLPGTTNVYISNDSSDFYKNVEVDDQGNYSIKGLPGAGTYSLYFSNCPTDDTCKVQTNETATIGAEEQSAEVNATLNTEYKGVDGTLTGSAIVGQTLTATSGGFTPDYTNVTTPTWVWYRISPDAQDSGELQEIPGATTSTYTLTTADKGYFVGAFQVSSSGDGYGYAEAHAGQTGTPVAAAYTGPATLPFAGAVQSVKGAGKVGKTLSAPTLAVPAGGRVTYQWYRVAKAGKHHRVVTKAIGGARTSHYKLKKKDKGTKVFVTEVVTAPGYATAAVSTKPVRVH